LNNTKNTSNKYVDYHSNEEDRVVAKIESTLKEILKTESEEHKKIIHEKNEKIGELNLKIKNYEILIKRINKDLESLNQKSYELTVEEIQKRDEIIEFITSEYENKFKIYEEEHKMISNLFHQLGYEFVSLIFNKSD